MRSTLSAAVLAATSVIAVQTSGERAASADRTERVRVLLLTGGHAFEREPFLQVFRADAALDVTHLEHSGESADAWLRADLDRVDAVVLYDMPRENRRRRVARFLSIAASVNRPVPECAARLLRGTRERTLPLVVPTEVLVVVAVATLTLT